MSSRVSSIIFSAYSYRTYKIPFEKICKKNILIPTQVVLGNCSVNEIESVRECIVHSNSKSGRLNNVKRHRRQSAVMNDVEKGIEYFDNKDKNEDGFEY
jgi:hypothetical protein